jgi:CheY-like chemotaxis protein/HPt (histidine-containing phosphotransfer) domain-containing protein
MEVRTTGSPEEARAWFSSGRPCDLVVFDRTNHAVDAAALPDRRIELVPGGSLDREASRAAVTKPLKPAQLHAAFATAFGAVASGAETRSAPPAAAKSLRILLADDSVINLRVGVAILESMGYRADTASNGAEAIEKLRSTAYQVVLMDVQMPEVDGWEATRRIRAGFPADRQPRIIAMTANVLEEDRKRCAEAGMDDYVSKPVRPAELKAALEKCGTGTAPPTTAPEPAKVPQEFPEGFNPEIVRSLRAISPPGQPDMFDELLQVYRPMLAELLEHIRQAVTAADGAALKQAAHKLRGSSANLGAAAIAETCARLEALGEGGRLESAADLLTELESRARKILQ